jgi:uncharacterized damage-inducible protein DinB
MAISQALLPEFDQEMANTRKALERIPDGKFGWKPHDKSSTLGALAGHVASLPNLASMAIGQDSFDMTKRPKPPQMDNRAEVLAVFDKTAAEARKAIASASDEHLMKTWSLLFGDKTLLTMPRAAVLRTLFLNHLIHHRGQLTVYLRLNNVPVPSIYGPSADENPFA